MLAKASATNSKKENGRETSTTNRTSASSPKRRSEIYRLQNGTGYLSWCYPRNNQASQSAQATSATLVFQSSSLTFLRLLLVVCLLFRPICICGIPSGRLASATIRNRRQHLVTRSRERSLIFLLAFHQRSPSLPLSYKTIVTQVPGTTECVVNPLKAKKRKIRIRKEPHTNRQGQQQCARLVCTVFWVHSSGLIDFLQTILYKLATTTTKVQHH